MKTEKCKTYNRLDKKNTKKSSDKYIIVPNLLCICYILHGIYSSQFGAVVAWLRVVGRGFEPRQAHHFV